MSTHKIYEIKGLTRHSPDNTVKESVKVYIEESSIEELLNTLNYFIRTSPKIRKYTGTLSVPITWRETTRHEDGDEYTREAHMGRISYRLEDGRIMAVDQDETFNVCKEALK